MVREMGSAVEVTTLSSTADAATELLEELLPQAASPKAIDSASNHASAFFIILSS
jgi:hypothetical protein